jgi:hypothetical protein
MDGLSLFGLGAVTAMLIFYALEDRSHWFILAFAGACGFGSIHGFVWAAVAVYRWGSSSGDRNLL